MALRNVIIFLLMPSFLFVVRSQAQTVPRFERSDAPVVDLPKNQKIEFGYLVVFEDRSNKKSKTIRLPVFILKSRSQNPKPDPILYTAGGPGSSSVTTAQYGEYYSYLDDRDFIVFEQRGTRYAQPNLACPELDKVKKSNAWIQSDELRREAMQVQAAEACQTRLISEGINLSAYNTKASADDIEDLRKVLGIEKLNIYSVSYSTKIAQVLLRDYGKSIRSAVLDSPLPLWVNYDETSLQIFETKMDLLFSACVADSACNINYPNLKQRFLNFLGEANKKPVMLQIKSPVDSSRITLALKGYEIASLINLGDTYNLKSLPALLNKLCTGDYKVLDPYVYNLFSDDSRAMGMRLSVWCAEEYPFENLNAATQTKNISSQYVGMKSSAVPLQICKIWKVQRANKKENRTFTSDIPVLLINGEFDPDTPSIWGEQMQKFFQNSYHFIFKGMSHTPTQYWDNNCGMELAQSFFNEPLKKPEVKCFAELKEVIFDTKK